MIDIHAHILPGVDDGSQSMEESLRMAKAAVESGVHTLIVTPHFHMEDSLEQGYYDLLLERYHALKYALRKEFIPVQLLLGSEVYATEEVPELLQKDKLITLNQSRYLLLEYDFKEDLALSEFVINEVVEQGYIPVIAHPERYPYVQKHPDIVTGWIAMGALLQINKGSLSGGFGRGAKETALHLLERNQVAVIATDAHGFNRRTTELAEAYQFVASRFSNEYAEALFEINPGLIAADKELSELPELMKVDI